MLNAGDKQKRALGKQLTQMRREAAEAEKRGTEVAGTLNGKKSAVLKKARETRTKAQSMQKDYLDRSSDGLDGFEFLTMAEAGEVGHWSVLQQMSRKAGNRDVSALVTWALPIQQRHFKLVTAASKALAAEEDPNETS